jgi:hypothetical protein
VWNLCKEVNGNFDLLNLVKYPYILHTTFFVGKVFELYC